MFAEKLFWLPWFYSTVLISSIVCVFFRVACQSCRHPQPWMASFIVRVSWPGRLFCWVWLLCDILWFLNTPHKIYYSPVRLKLQNVSPPVYIHLYCFIPRISHFVLCVHKFASLSPPHPFLPPIRLSTSGLEPYLRFLVRSQGWKGWSIPPLGQVWISNGCQHVPGARWDHSGTTRAPAKSLACLPKEVGVCADRGWCRHYLSLYLIWFWWRMLFRSGMTTANEGYSSPLWFFFTIPGVTRGVRAPVTCGGKSYVAWEKTRGVFVWYDSSWQKRSRGVCCS